MTTCERCNAQMEQRITTTSEPWIENNFAKNRDTINLVGIRVYTCKACKVEDVEYPRMNSLCDLVETNPDASTFTFGWHVAGKS